MKLLPCRKKLCRSAEMERLDSRCRCGTQGLEGTHARAKTHAHAYIHHTKCMHRHTHTQLAHYFPFFGIKTVFQSCTWETSMNILEEFSFSQSSSWSEDAGLLWPSGRKRLSVISHQSRNKLAASMGRRMKKDPKNRHRPLRQDALENV